MMISPLKKHVRKALNSLRPWSGYTIAACLQHFQAAILQHLPPLSQLGHVLAFRPSCGEHRPRDPPSTDEKMWVGVTPRLSFPATHTSR
jgi:hypothetical protein